MDPLIRDFRRWVNMSPAEIRRWYKDPRSTCYSQARTRERLVRDHRYRGPGKARARKKLPSLARLVSMAREGQIRDPEIREYARAVINFNKRHAAQAKKQGCSPGRAVALRNWGFRMCSVPATCSRAKRNRGAR